MENSNEDHQNGKRHRRTESRGRSRSITISLDDLDDVDQAVRNALGKGRDVASSVGESIKDSINAVRSTRDSVVMVRVNRDAIDSLDELVESGVANSRSAAAAFLIGEGITARADLFEKIAEQTRVIRAAKEKLRLLLADESDSDDNAE